MNQTKPTIPARKSSLKQSSSRLSGSKRNLSGIPQPELKAAMKEAKLRKKKSETTLTALTPMSDEYWIEKSKHEELMEEHDKIYYDQEDASNAEWSSSDKAQGVLTTIRTRRSQADLYRKQAKNLDRSAGIPSGVKHAFIMNFMTGNLGLGMKIPKDKKAGKSNCRDKSVQHNSRDLLIEKYNSKHPDPRKETLYCPITQMHHAASAMTAAYIFPLKHGRESMNAVFGKEAIDEINTDKNAMMMLKDVEQRFDAYSLTLVPDIEDLGSEEQMNTWSRSEPKSYKIWVVRPEFDTMKTEVPYMDISFAQLDGRKVEFGDTTARPRARYLYFHYLCCIIKKMGHFSDDQHIQGQWGKHFWGTMGKYFPKSMLRGFAEHFGHEYEALMEPYDRGDDDEEVDYAGAWAVNQMILRSTNSENGDEDDDGEDVEDDDDEDDDTTEVTEE